MSIKFNSSDASSAIAEFAKKRGVEEIDIWQAAADALQVAYDKMPECSDDYTAIEIDIDSGEIVVRHLSSGADVTPDTFGRIAAHVFRSIVTGKIDEILRSAAAQKYKGMEGTLVTGRVKHVTSSRAIIQIGEAEAVLPRSEVPPGAVFNIGDDVTALILRLKESGSDVMVLSQVEPGFLRSLVADRVFAVSSGRVIVTNIVREPGRAAKVIVTAGPSGVKDPVGAVIGAGGSSIREVTSLLCKERVDVVEESNNFEELLFRLLGVDSVAINEVSETQVTVSCAPEDRSRVIGFKGSNIRLASKALEFEIVLAE
jgi:transcription termination/antitermination protein NusA